MAEDNSKLCKQLDAIAIEYLELHTKLDAVMKRLESAQRDGYINMSRARVAMGQRSLCALQYNPPPISQTVVQVIQKSEQATQYSLVEDNKTEVVGGTSGSQDDGADTMENSRSEKTLRRRRQGDNDTKSSEESIPEEKECKKDGTNLNPIRWFGVLVPGSLRQSQTSFKKVIQYTTEVANIHSLLAFNRVEYGKLMALKRQSEQSAGADE